MQSWFKTKIKDKKYLAYIKTLKCHLCHRPSDDAHHCGDGVSCRRHRDDIVVPVCRMCHRKVHDREWEYKEALRTAAVTYRTSYTEACCDG